MPRVFILDPEFSHAGGHYFTANSTFAGRINPRVIIHASQHVDPALTIDGTVIKPTFFNLGRSQRLRAKRLSILGHIFSFTKSSGLQWLPKSRIYGPSIAHVFESERMNESDHLLIHSGNAVFLESLVSILSAKDPSERPQLHYRDAAPAPFQTDDIDAYRGLAHLCNQGSAEVYYETDAYAECLKHAGISEARLCKIEMAELGRLYPLPSLEKRLRVAILGAYREEKGPLRLPSIARRYNQLARAKGLPEIEYVIHTPDVEGSADRYKKLTERLQDGQIHHHYSEGSGLNTGYLDYMLNSHVVLLPYDPEVYQVRGSGLGCDAVANGRIVVSQGDCAVCEYVRGGNGLTAVSDEDFANALIGVVSDYERFSQNAYRQAETFRAALENHPLFVRLNGMRDTQPAV